MKALLGFILGLAINAAAQAPILRGPLTTNTPTASSNMVRNIAVEGTNVNIKQLTVRTPTSGNGGAITILPSSTNAAWDNSPLTLGGHYTAAQSTNMNTAWLLWGINSDKQGNVLDTNRHHLKLIVEKNWDPADASNLRNMEYWMEFIARSNAWSQRVDAAVYGDSPNTSERTFYGSRIYFGHPSYVNQQGAFIANNGSYNSSMEVKGQILSSGNTGAGGSLAAAGSGGYAGGVNVANAANTKFTSLYGDGDAFGLGTDVGLILTSQPELVLWPGQRVHIKTNLLVDGTSYANNFYSTNDISALTFTDRSHAPDDTKSAWEIIKSHKVKNGRVDHDALSTKAWAGDKSGRNLSMVVSAQSMALQDLSRKLNIIYWLFGAALIGIGVAVILIRK